MQKAAVLLCLSYSLVWAQGPSPIPSDQLDPTRHLTDAQLESAAHTPLPEQCIWTREDAIPHHPPFDVGEPTEKDPQLGEHYFRRSFQLDSVPHDATLYIAGPRSATIYLNGRRVQSFVADGERVFAYGLRTSSADVKPMLKKGRNVLAIEAVRGSNKILVVKIVPAVWGAVVPPLLVSDTQWKGAMQAAAGWQDAGFDDSAWQAADSLGGIETRFLLLNSDAGLYDWPGYDGISPFLEQYKLPAVAVTHVYPGLSGHMDHLEALTHVNAPGAGNEFRVRLPSALVEQTAAPHLLLDFGREVAGRVAIRSGSDTPADVTVQYGESENEAMQSSLLGINPVHVAPHTTAYGPKSGFRYALIRFVGGENTRYESIQLAGIDYPVKYQGFFESSDARLNRMWTIGAYTAHLCMQDDIWDAPKRDRNRFTGDLDVSGRTIDEVFNDHFLMEQTLDRLMPETPITQHINGIPGYSAYRMTNEAEYYRHTGSKQQLAAFHDRLVQLMHFMEKDLDSHNVYVNNTHSWPFMDWSPELFGDMPEARWGTQLEYYAGFEQGVYLLNEMGDTGNAQIFQRHAEQIKAAAQQYLVDTSTNSFGARWQTNAMAVLFGVADPSQYDSIWKTSLASVGHIKYKALIASPYGNYYIVSAMAKMGHRAEALDWIRQYWGGTIDEGATSFWEGYDPSWSKGNYHASLNADDTSGYIIDLANGWSSGVTPWLMEQVLGIHAAGAGFSTVDIRPDLIDLQWAKGGEATPRGMLTVSIRKSSGLETTIDLPSGTEAHVSVPVPSANAQVLVNGQSQSSTPAENGSRAIITLATAGHYVIQAQ